MSGRIKFLCLSVLAGLVGITLLSGPAGWAARAQAPTDAVFNALGFATDDYVDSRAEAVSANGKMVVGYHRSLSENYGDRGFVWSGETGTAVRLEANATSTYGWCISSDGTQAAGRAWIDGVIGHRACLWSHDLGSGFWVPHMLPGLKDPPFYLDQLCVYGMNPDASILVGVAQTDRGYEACRWISTIENETRVWTIESLGDLPGGSVKAEAWSCSADGRIVVGASEVKFGWHGFRWENGMMTDLGTLAKKKFSAAWSISADGSRIVGECWNTRGKDETATLWQNGKMTAIPDLPGGKTLNEATGISPDGRYVVGWGSTANGVEAYIYDTVSRTLSSIKALLQNQGNVLPNNWTPQFAAAVTNADANGQVTVVGRGLNPLGKVEGYRAVITP